LKSPLPVINEFQNQLFIGKLLPPKLDSRKFSQVKDGNFDETRQSQ
jgi:WD40 repeat protein